MIQLMKKKRIPNASNPLFKVFDLKKISYRIIIGRLRFHDDNENENDNEISPSFLLRFVHKEMNDSPLAFRRLLQR